MTNLELPGIPPAPRKRGRPSTGRAMSAAQRKARQRTLAVQRIAGGVAMAEVPLTSLLEELQSCLKAQHGSLARKICAELTRRAELLGD